MTRRSSTRLVVRQRPLWTLFVPNIFSLSLCLSLTFSFYFCLLFLPLSFSLSDKSLHISLPLSLSLCLCLLTLSGQFLFIFLSLSLYDSVFSQFLSFLRVVCIFISLSFSLRFSILSFSLYFWLCFYHSLFDFIFLPFFILHSDYVSLSLYIFYRKTLPKLQKQFYYISSSCEANNTRIFGAEVTVGYLLYCELKRYDWMLQFMFLFW